MEQNVTLWLKIELTWSMEEYPTFGDISSHGVCKFSSSGRKLNAFIKHWSYSGVQSMPYDSWRGPWTLALFKSFNPIIFCSFFDPRLKSRHNQTKVLHGSFSTLRFLETNNSYKSVVEQSPWLSKCGCQIVYRQHMVFNCYSNAVARVKTHFIFPFISELGINQNIADVSLRNQGICA